LKWDIYATKACLLRELNNQKRKLKKFGKIKNSNLKAKMNKPRSSKEG
jgi:hypothetical protein